MEDRIADNMVFGMVPFQMLCFANSILMVEAIFQTNDMLKHGHMVISLPVFRHFSTSYALTVR